MKKSYKLIKFKKFNSRRSERAQKQKRKQKKRKTKRQKFQTVPISKGSTVEYEKIMAPQIFSIVSNSNETIKFLSTIHDFINRRKSFNMDLSCVQSITPDVITYLLLLINEANNTHVSFRGNAPNAQKPKNQFINSGFYDYVKSNYQNFSFNDDIVAVKKGKKADGDVAEEIRNFMQSKIKVTNQQLCALYAAIIECMSNTNYHAGRTQGTTYWWTMALYDDSESKVYVSFVDNGLGIPTTVKKKFKNIMNSDETLLREAVDGNNMSKEGVFRNKGLPQIKKQFTEGDIENLVFVSNNGYYSLKENSAEYLNHKFIGTLISWEFSGEKI